MGGITIGYHVGNTFTAVYRYLMLPTKPEKEPYIPSYAMFLEMKRLPNYKPYMFILCCSVIQVAHSN